MHFISTLIVGRQRWRVGRLPKAMPSTAIWLTIIVLIGLTLRLIWALHVQPEPFGDTYWYINAATNLAEGKGFVANHHNPLSEPPDTPLPTAYYPPAYPLALAGVFKVFGVSLTSAKVFNAVLGALTIPFVYVIARRLFDRRVGLLAAAAFALFPNAIVWLPLPLSEPLFTLLFTAALWVLVAFRSKPFAFGAAAAVGFGLLAGLATLTRGTGLVLLPVALLFWLMRDGGRTGLRQLGLTLLATAAVLMPWTIRNWVVVDSPIVLASNTGVNLRMGHGPDANGTVILLNDTVYGIPGWRSLERPEWEVEGYRFYTQRAIHYALTHPGRELELSAQKIRYLYQSDSSELPALTAWGGAPLRPSGLEDVLGPLTDASWYTVLFAALGLAPFWLRRTPQQVMFVAVLVFWTLFHVVFFGLPRFHLPLFPLLIVAAAGGLWTAVGTLCSWFGRLFPQRLRLPGERAVAPR